MAAPHDDGAKKLIQKAMYEDYVETNFADAGKKLEQAVELCQAKTDCSPAVRARVLLDLGVVEFVLQRADEGRAHLARAVQEDPKIALEADFSTPDLVKEFAAAKGATPAATPAPEGSTEPAAPDAAPPAAPKSPDCPPNFPGCNATPSSCSSNEDCSDGLKCVDGSCAAAEQTEDEVSKPYAKNWLTVAFQEDFLLLPGATNACAGGAGYTCFDANTGAYYAGVPNPGHDDLINSGPAPATMEILVGYDRFFTRNFELGTRLGYILGGGPQRPGGANFLPVHIEARAAYWFGKNPIARKGFRFYLELGSGLSEVDGNLTIDVFQSQNANGVGGPYKGSSTNEVAWTKTGTGFAAFGPGLMYAITPITGILLEVKAMEMFPTLGTGFGAQLGYTYGF
jgi:hypothetical protein